MRSMLAMVVVVPSLLVACAPDEGLDDSGAADIQGEEKADTGPGIEVTARIQPGAFDGELSTSVPRRGYVFYAAEGATVSLEVTQAGSSAGLDTILKVYGPRLADGTYPTTIASDEDAGYGKLSRLRDVQIKIPGFYLAEMSFSPNTMPADGKKARLKLACAGSCETALPIDSDAGLKWYRRSAERRALAAQAYAIASEKLTAKAPTYSGAWAVVLDIDETTLNNSKYQQERMDLGVGYSPGSWTAWVNRRAATPIDGVVDFTNLVHTLGGKVAFVSNRMQANECAQTEDNLHAAGITYEAILCKTDTSDKNPRFTTLSQTYKLVMFVGDNIMDFPGLTQDIRKQPASAFDRFGEDFILLPNSMYGSWEKNLDDNSL